MPGRAANPPSGSASSCLEHPGGIVDAELMHDLAADVLRQGAEPAQGGVVVVRPRVVHGVRADVLRLVRIVRVVVEGELQHRHPGEVELPAQGRDLGGDDAEILGHQRNRAHLVEQGLEQRRTRHRLPVAVHRGVVVGGDGPHRDQAAKVVDTHQVEPFEVVAQARPPPLEAAVVHRRPVVMGIAPALPGGGEVVRRHTRHHLRMPFRVEQEILRVGPDVGAVVGDEDRHVAEQADAARRRVRVHGLPPGVGAELLEDAGLDGAGMRLREVAQCRVLAAPQRLRPVGPRRTAVHRLDGHEQRVVLDPMALRDAPGREALRVDGDGAEAGKQGRVDRERRRALVRRASGKGAAKRQDLPHADACGLEQVEPARSVSEIARGQRGRVQQDAGAARSPHPTFLRMVPAFSAWPPPRDSGASSAAGAAMPSRRYSSRSWVR